MQWYHYVIAALPALWIWFFIGGGVVALVEYAFDQAVTVPDNEDMEETVYHAMLAFFWPIGAVVLAVAGCWFVLRHAPAMPARLLNRRTIPEAKVVK